MIYYYKKIIQKKYAKLQMLYKRSPNDKNKNLNKQ